MTSKLNIHQELREPDRKENDEIHVLKVFSGLTSSWQAAQSVV